VLYKDPDDALKMVKKLSVKRWTLLTLNGCHLGIVAEGEGPPTCFQTCETATKLALMAA